MALLRILRGENQDRVHPLEDARLIVGRASSDLPLVDEYLSRRHAEIFYDGDRYYIRDLGSRNGTYLDDSRIDDTRSLHAGSEITIGATLLAFEDRPAREGERRDLAFGDTSLGILQQDRFRAPLDHTVGQKMGPYEIQSLLGQGGMGIVLLAEQLEPVHRQVALKVARDSSRHCRLVFSSEETALRRMDHPNIAKIYDSGITDEGHPFLAMEFVPGRSLSEHCDENGLSVEERLELLLSVCEGVHHAHDQGVVHRDLKPSNILVAENGVAVPKLLDFGLAWFTEKPRGSSPDRSRRIVGTPAYMSPEQALAQTVDPRSDVYSLGVVLYRLLVGEFPFDLPGAVSVPDTASSFQGVARLNWIQSRFDDETPPPPSERFSALARDSAIEVAQKRNASVAALRQEIHGDLDAITLKAMHRDRRHRYASAAEFSSAIRALLGDPPQVTGAGRRRQPEDWPLPPTEMEYLACSVPTRRIRRYTDIQFPKLCRVSIPAELTIQMTIEAGNEDALTRAIDLAVQEEQNCVELLVVVTALAFQVQPKMARLEVPVRANSNTLTFKLTPQETGTQWIEVEFFLESERVGYFTIESKVIDHDQ